MEMTERSDIHKSSIINAGFAGLGLRKPASPSSLTPDYRLCPASYLILDLWYFSFSSSDKFSW
jgi:hypothetical protein